MGYVQFRNLNHQDLLLWRWSGGQQWWAGVTQSRILVYSDVFTVYSHEMTHRVGR